MRAVVTLGLLVPVLAACGATTATPAPTSPVAVVTRPAAPPAAGPFLVSHPRCAGTSYSITLTNVSRTLTAAVGLDVEFFDGHQVRAMGESAVTPPVPPGDSVTATSRNPSGNSRDTCVLSDYYVVMPDGSYPTYAAAGS